MTVLALTYLLSIGTLDQMSAIGYGQNWLASVSPANSYTTTLSIGLVAFEHVYARANIQTSEQYSRSVFFSPYSTDYSVDVGVHFGILYIGFRHDCLHPVISQLPVPDIVRFGSNATSFYAELRGSVDLIKPAD